MKRSDHLDPRALEQYFTSLNDKLLVTLLRTTVDFDDSVHQARKRLKEIRAFLRMCKPISGSQTDKYHQYLRELSTNLGQYRDQYVLQSVWNSFQSHLPRSINVPTLPGVLIRPEHYIEEHQDDQQEFTGKLIGIARQLLCLSNPVKETMRHSHIDNQWLIKRYRWFYRRCKKAHAQIGREPSAPQYHKLRKHLKDEMYALRLIRSEWNEFTCQRYKQLKQTTEKLGQANDLDLLLRVFQENTSTENHLLVTLIGERQKRQWAKAEKTLSQLLELSAKEYIEQFPL